MSLAFTFPGGTLKTVNLTATAGDVLANKSPGASKRWHVLYGRITLVADANAANRNIRVEITDGTNVLYRLKATDLITASQTKSLNFGPSIEDEGMQVLDLSYLAINPGGLIIEGVDQFRLLIGNGLAGDSYSGFLRVIEIGITP